MGLSWVLRASDQVIIDHDLLRPINAEVGKADLAHHGVAGFVPELAGHVAVVVPRFARRFGDDAGHHLGHVHLAQPLVEHHQRLGLGRELLVVEEDLGVHAHVVGIGEALVPLRDAVVLVGLGGMPALDGVGPRGRSAIQPAGGGQAIIQQRQPIRHALAAGVVHQRGDGFARRTPACRPVPAGRSGRGGRWDDPPAGWCPADGCSSAAFSAGTAFS